MIYLTNADGNGNPCIEITGLPLRMFHCKDESALYASLINLAKTSNNVFKIFDVYGHEILIPNNPLQFIVKEVVKEFVGKIFTSASLGSIVNYLGKNSLRLRVDLRARTIYAKLINEINAEELLIRGIALVNPVKIPNISMAVMRGENAESRLREGNQPGKT